MLRSVFAIFALSLIAYAQAPAKQVYGTWFAAPVQTDLKAMTVDQAGFVTLGGYEVTEINGSLCVFVTRLNQSGTATLWRRCVEMDVLKSMASDGAGNVYVWGGAYTPSTGYWGVIDRFTPDGQLVWERRIQGVPYPGVLALDQSGAIFLTGGASAGFVTTPGAYSSDPSKSNFLMKLNPDSSTVFSTFVDWGALGLAVDSGGRPWLVGYKCFGVNCSGSGGAATIFTMDPSGSSVSFKLSFGGAPYYPSGGRVDSAVSVAIDDKDAAWITGIAETESVPVTTGPPPTGKFIPRTVFVLKLSALGDVLYGSYFDPALGITLPIAVDAAGQPYFSQIQSFGRSKVIGLSTDGSTRFSLDYGS